MTDLDLLRSIHRLAPEAHGVALYKDLCPALGVPVSFGAIYARLDRLEELGEVESWDGPPVPERGGRPRRCWRLTEGGIRRLSEWQVQDAGSGTVSVEQLGDTP